LLLTDGLANVGITDDAALVELTRRAGAERVGTSTIGFGHDFAEELLTQMADAGGGNAHWAETPDAAPAIFAEELEGLTRVVAQNVSVEIRPREDVEVLAILNEYPQVQVAGGVQVQLGDGYGGERRRVVFSLQVPRLGELGPVHLADLVLRYVGVGEEIAHHEQTIPAVANAVSAAEAAGIAPDDEVREEVLLLKAGRAREEAIRLADAGDYDAAQQVTRDVVKRLRLAGLDSEADGLESHAPMLDAASYSPAQRKRMWFEQHQARRRRR
jgi:Ca-activated chloride channel family protein